MTGGQGADGTGDRPTGDLGWLLTNFARRTVGVTEAVAVSSDGFVLASSTGAETRGIDHFAAIISGLTSLTRGAAELYDLDDVRQVVVEMGRGYLFVMSVDDGSTVGVLADAGCDVGSVGYEMALLIARVGAVLTPDLIDELKHALTLDEQ
ncbi:MAG: roadblock/LC7 domain-containing protein [Acidimicrobiales bacterium]